jgi:ribose 5-phosphate isomerase B
MRIAIGSDERSEATDALVRSLIKRGHQLVTALGPLRESPLVPASADGSGDEDWVQVGRGVAEQVANQQADQGIVCCWTGTGASIAANKVRGVRAALCTDAETTAGARKWNDANVLALSVRLLKADQVDEILDVWFSTSPDNSEQSRLEMLE